MSRYILLLCLWGLLFSCGEESPKATFRIQLYVDVSASAVDLTSRDSFWTENLTNFVNDLRNGDQLRIYKVGRSIIELSGWLENPKVEDFNKYTNDLFPKEAQNEKGTCVRGILSNATSQIELSQKKYSKNILGIVFDEDEGTSECSSLSDREWREWFQETTQKARVIIFPLDPDNKFATKLSYLSKEFELGVIICRRNSEPICHNDQLKEWRKN